MTLLPRLEQLETERLIFRRMMPADLDFFVDIHDDPAVARYIGAGNTRSRAETEEWLQRILASYHSVDLGQLTVVRKADGVHMGRCGLSDAAIEVVAPDAGSLRRGWFFRADVPPGTAVDPLPELGYTFARAWWGNGYASEAAGKVFAYARECLPYATIMSVIHPANAASRAVATKFGVELIDRMELAGRAFDRFHWPMATRLRDPGYRAAVA